MKKGSLNIKSDSLNYRQQQELIYGNEKKVEDKKLSTLKAFKQMAAELKAAAAAKK